MYAWPPRNKTYIQEGIVSCYPETEMNLLRSVITCFSMRSPAWFTSHSEENGRKRTLTLKRFLKKIIGLFRYSLHWGRKEHTNFCHFPRTIHSWCCFCLPIMSLICTIQKNNNCAIRRNQLKLFRIERGWLYSCCEFLLQLIGQLCFLFWSKKTPYRPLNSTKNLFETS